MNCKDPDAFKVTMLEQDFAARHGRQQSNYFGKCSHCKLHAQPICHPPANWVLVEEFNLSYHDKETMLTYVNYRSLFW